MNWYSILSPRKNKNPLHFQLAEDEEPIFETSFYYSAAHINSLLIIPSFSANL
jgi:hypothetical protein